MLYNYYDVMYKEESRLPSSFSRSVVRRSLIHTCLTRRGALPDLEQDWMAVFKLHAAEETFRQLVAEYEREREIETSLRGNISMEETNLTRLHQQTLYRKRSP